MDYQPKEAPKDIPKCYKLCIEQGMGYHACTATGRSILNERTIQCATCHHYMIEREAQNVKNCPLCHAFVALDDAMITIVEEEEGED